VVFPLPLEPTNPTMGRVDSMLDSFLAEPTLPAQMLANT
jgi:hypothetical protein